MEDDLQYWLNLDEETIKTLRAILKMVNRTALILLVLIFVGPMAILLFSLNIWTQSWPGCLLLVLFVSSIYIFSNWDQVRN